mgnify:CR=1 FL=1
MRDGRLWCTDSPLGHELAEAMLLTALGLLEYVQLGIFDLTALGERYLAGIEASTPAIGRPGPRPA